MFKKYFAKTNSTVFSLQFIQLLRFTILFLISIAFAKSRYSVNDIGIYEKFVYFAGALTFFWTNGLIQSLLGKYNSYKSLREQAEYTFNTVLVSFAFSLLIFILVFTFEKPLSLFFINNETIPYKLIFLLYLLISPPTFFIEYIYLLKQKFKSIYAYGTISYVAQLVLVVVPSFISNNLEYSLIGLLIITLIRLAWLIVVIRKYGIVRVSLRHINCALKSARPLILGAFLSGSIPYIDGIIVSMNYNDTIFAIFRYGARELPISLLLANALSNAMIPIINSSSSIIHSVRQLKIQALQLMHLLFPLSIFLLLLSYYIFKYLFNPNFMYSASIFNVMLLLIIPRMLFPQTILMATHNNRYILIGSVVEWISKILLSVILLYYFDIIGIAWATVIAFIIEKCILMYFVYKKIKLLPKHYTFLKWHLFYSILIIATYFVVELLQ